MIGTFELTLSRSDLESRYKIGEMDISSSFFLHGNKAVHGSTLPEQTYWISQELGVGCSLIVLLDVIESGIINVDRASFLNVFNILELSTFKTAEDGGRGTVVLCTGGWVVTFCICTDNRNEQIEYRIFYIILMISRQAVLIAQQCHLVNSCGIPQAFPFNSLPDHLTLYREISQISAS
jgi:hypothetical protein